jgi:hypothetical protein
MPEVKNPFETSLAYAQQHTTTGTESKTKQFTLGLAHTVDDHWDGRIDLTYWKDSISDVHYVGPTVGFTYTWTDGERAQSPEKSGAEPDKTGYQLIEEVMKTEPVTRPSDKNETATEPPPPNEVAALSFNCDFYFYGTEVLASSTTRRVFDRQQRRFVDQVIPPTDTKQSVTQTHPSVTFEKPFLDSKLTPYLTAGHYVYSKDPAAIEDLAGRPRFAASATQLNGLVGGFLNNNGELGVRSVLPGDVDLALRLGAEQSVTDNTWSTLQGATLSRHFGDHLKAKADWSRSIQSGISSDTLTGGLTYTF